MRTLYQRLEYDGACDFLRIANAYIREDCNDYVRNMKKHFALVIDNDPRYLNHDEVLALSVGGSNTKVLIAGTKDGLLDVKHIAAVKNPKVQTHFYDFLDELLIKDQAVYSYLTQNPKPVMCVVLPVMIAEDGIPQHPKKIPTITGMLARGPEDMVPAMNVANNMSTYFHSRGIPVPQLYYQPDPPIAHLGGVSQITRYKKGQRTFLLVCGTGMATADDNVSRTISRTQVLDMDAGLFPPEKTEGCLYECGCSGILFHGVMRRAIEIREKEPGSALAGCEAWRYFSCSDDSELICRLWESTFDLNIRNERVRKMKSEFSPEAFEELQHIASLLMQRLHGTLANAILATAVKMNIRDGYSPYHVIFEGSVALNPYSRALIFKEVEDRLKRTELFASMNVEVPEIDMVFRDRKPILYAPDIPEKLQGKLDISLIGTAIAAITDDIIVNG